MQTIAQVSEYLTAVHTRFQLVLDTSGLFYRQSDESLSFGRRADIRINLLIPSKTVVAFSIMVVCFR